MNLAETCTIRYEHTVRDHVLEFIASKGALQAEWVHFPQSITSALQNTNTGYWNVSSFKGLCAEDRTVIAESGYSTTEIEIANPPF